MRIHEASVAALFERSAWSGWRSFLVVVFVPPIATLGAAFARALCEAVNGSG
ncbi:MAG: hypothetical protein ACRDRH_05185 [Pseudonocardia sp.]